MVKVRGRNSNGKTVKQTAKNWHVRAFVTSWCHTGATSQSCKVTRLNQDIRDQPESARVKWWQSWCWHDDDCDRHLAHHRDAVQSRCFEPWPDVTGNFRNFLVLVGFLLASFDRGLLQWCVLVNQSVEVDCEDHVLPVNYLEPYDSNQSAAFLTLHENDGTLFMCSWLLAHRRQTTKLKDHPKLSPVLEVALDHGTTTCDASGLGGFVRRYLSTRNLRKTSNFFRCTMYLVSPSVLCHCLVKQHSRKDKKNKK